MSDSVKITAPLNGRISVKALQGSYVKEGDLVAVQISAKTESQIKAPRAGRVTSIVGDGTSLTEGEIIAEIGD
ncbi:hypothetical protein M0805_006547 [Coniferiporia weirii]|nr:hypothetical protein M0805_006547 [Coniferiporia weirii]